MARPVMTAGSPLRYCARCGTRLAGDNRDTVCGPCLRRQADSQLASCPPQVPAEFWRVDLIRDSLAQRHMGHFLRAYREHPFHGRRGIPQEVMGRWLHLSQTQLSRIETGPPIQDLQRLIEWARLFRIPPALLWFDIGKQQALDPDENDGFLGAWAGDLVSPNAGKHVAETTAADISSAARTDSIGLDFPLSARAFAAEHALDAGYPHVLNHISDALPYYARTANFLGSRILVELVERYIRILCSGSENACGKYRDQILNTCARYAEFLGWLHQDLGDPMLSLFWTDRAMEWSQEAGIDLQFQSYVLMRKADHAEQYGSPFRVIALSRAALKITPLSPRAQALAVQQEARGHSQDGDRAQFERKLNEARELITKPGGSEDAPWGDYCDLTHIAMQEASGWVELGHHDKAISILERHLPAISSLNRVDSVVFRARLARAYAESGYPDRAAQTALGTCSDAQATESARVFAELTHVNRILATSKDTPLARNFVQSFKSLADHLTTTARQAT